MKRKKKKCNHEDDPNLFCKACGKAIGTFGTTEVMRDGKRIVI